MIEAAEAGRPILRVDGLTVEFRGEEGTVRAVDRVSFELRRGEALGVAGESGAGKSAMALALATLWSGPNVSVTGSVRLDGIELVAAPEAELQRIRGGRIGTVFQDPMSSFNPVYRVGDQVAEAVEAHGRVGRRAAGERAVKLMAEAGLDDAPTLARSYPHELSGGMRQRAMIAMALASEPEILVADEPTSALDVTVQAQILSLLARLREERRLAIVLVSHDLGVLARACDRVAVMYAGRIVEQGPLGRLLESPQEPQTKALVAASTALRRPRPHGRARVTATASPGNGAMLEVQGLVKHFAGRSSGPFARRGRPVRAVDGVSFSIAPGETLGLVGESGCGKTTLCRSLLRLVEPTAGSVRFAGTELTALGRRELRALRSRMQMVFQDPYSSLNPRKRVAEIVGEPMRLYGIADGAALRSRTGELLERVGLAPEHGERFPHEFSGGQRQRIGLARALALRPSLIVADEPLSALDVTIQAQIVALMRELQQELGLTYLFVSHDLGLVRHISDRIAVMRAGELVEVGPAEELSERPADPYTKALLDAVPALPGNGTDHRTPPRAD